MLIYFLTCPVMTMQQVLLLSLTIRRVSNIINSPYFPAECADVRGVPGYFKLGMQINPTSDFSERPAPNNLHQ
jgi:hypothetical protein